MSIIEPTNQTRTTAVLNAVLLTLILSIGISSVSSAFFSNQPSLVIGVYLGLLAVLVSLYGLMQFGYVQLTSWLLLGFGWLLAMGTNLAFGSLQSPLLGGFLLLLVIGALLLGRVGALVTVLLNALALLLLYMLPAIGPAINSDPINNLVINFSYGLSTALFLYIAARTTEEAYQQAQRNETMLRRALADLGETTVSKDYVDKILRSMSNMLIVLDPHGKIQTVNPATVKALGYSETELIGMPFNLLVLADDHDSLTSTLLMQTDALRNVDQVYCTKDGRRIPISLSSSVMQADDGKVMGVVCLAQDETERKQAQQQLNYQARLLENVSDAIIATDLSMQIMSWNRAAEKIYGWQADEVMGRNLAEVMKATDTAGQPVDLIKNRHMQRDHWRDEVVQRTRDGDTLHVLTSFSLIRDDKGKPTGVICINHDITQRKEIELALQRRAAELATLRRMDTQINSTLDIKRVISVALEAAARLAGADSGFLLLLEDEYNPQMIHKLGGYMALPPEPDDFYTKNGVAGRVIHTHEAEFVPDVTQDPDYIPDVPGTHSLMTVPLMAQDRLLGVVNLETTEPGRFTPEVFDFIKLLTTRIAIAVDNARLYGVSQSQLTELQNLYAQVSELENLKTDMIRIASHDLRAPLGLITGYVELLRMDANDRLTDTENEYIDMMNNSVQRMQIIIDNILSLERIQEIATEPFKDQVDIRELMQRALVNLWHQAGLKKQDLIMKCDLPELFIYGDSTQLYEAIANLINNAIKYTPKGGRIEADLQYIPDEQIRVTVEDTGYGVSAESQEKLFQPFFRAEKHQSVEGVGLGLYLVKKIVQRHNGEMILESQSGVGSTFGFEIPIRPEPASDITLPTAELADGK